MKNKFVNFYHLGENTIASIALFALVLIPSMEVFIRLFFKTGFPDSGALIPHAVLWVTFLAGMLTSRSREHLSLTIIHGNLKEPWKSVIDAANSFLGTMIATAFAISSLSMVLFAFDPVQMVGPFPIRLATIIVPIGYAVMAVRFIFWKDESLKVRLIASLGLIPGVLLALPPIVNVLSYINPDIPFFWYDLSDSFYAVMPYLDFPLVLILIAGGLIGTPIFILLGGIAYILFAGNWGSLEVLPLEAYDLLTGKSIPAIPLFTFAGFILSESNSGKRLVGLFKAWFGWLPGGMAVVAVLVCAFFTTFTGASGVTILALGGLLAYVLTDSGGYSKKFTTGLLTSSGSIGLLFPPSLPIILYGVMAQISIKDMFVGGLIPGAIMVLALSLMGVRQAMTNGVKSIPFNLKDALSSLKEASGEILLPVIILLGYFGGITTIEETGAIAVLYSVVLVVFIKRDMKFKEMGAVILKVMPIIGGVLVILAMAKGLSYFIVDAEIPMRLSALMEAHISSKYVFLILLNILLLLTGCLMDIFSAIIVVGPLILPLGELYGIHPVHLGIIFLANLELGYLTPPVGLNLFLASYRFEMPLTKVYKTIIPFFLLLVLMVLLITYVPWFSTGLLSIIN
ncbi:TRAP transporter large permease subunit [Spirochaeta isovalerica]|uniref:Tripartite ATP-independent transporter DctM subunit n=1 Tax=Spirochaeta isovalerica TaxID=150 RepID=A0A841RHM6_9SPIO|nr:tripartite ATP-independent transporter DctM subunit [Spirochaeta isovalerica]